MSHHKFCPDKQQYNIANPFPVYVLEIAVVVNFMNVSNKNLGYVHDVHASE